MDLNPYQTRMSQRGLQQGKGQKHLVGGRLSLFHWAWKIILVYKLNRKEKKRNETKQNKTKQNKTKGNKRKQKEKRGDRRAQTPYSTHNFSDTDLLAATAITIPSWSACAVCQT